jgi:copper chaperone CopZ
MQAVHIKTHGMKCQDCTALVEQSLLHIRGIRGVVAVQSMGLTSVLFDEAVIDSDRIAESIRSMGFEVERPRLC